MKLNPALGRRSNETGNMRRLDQMEKFALTQFDTEAYLSTLEIEMELRLLIFRFFEIFISLAKLSVFNISI